MMSLLENGSVLLNRPKLTNSDRLGGSGHDHGDSTALSRNRHGTGHGGDGNLSCTATYLTLIADYIHDTYRFIKRVLSKQLLYILRQEEARSVPYLTILVTISCATLAICTHYTDSLALFSYAYLLVFDIFSLLTVLLTVWVSFQQHSTLYTFGYEVFEVYAVFCSAVLSMVASLFIMKEGLERLFQQPDVNIESLMYPVGTLTAFLSHLAVYYLANNRALKFVVDAATSNTLQEHFSEISNSVCGVVPVLSSILLPRVSTVPLLSWCGLLLLAINYLIIHVDGSQRCDSVISIIYSVMVVVSMAPVITYTGSVLTQTTPTYLVSQLDKCLREASTLDGVLEFRGEHFWTVSFGKLVGFLQVRISREADEQLVLAHINNKLSQLITSSSCLTVHLFKEDSKHHHHPHHHRHLNLLNTPLSTASTSITSTPLSNTRPTATPLSNTTPTAAPLSNTRTNLPPSGAPISNQSTPLSRLGAPLSNIGGAPISGVRAPVFTSTGIIGAPVTTPKL